MSSPTSRSLALLRKEGWLAQTVEQFVRFPPPGHRKDLFNIIDILGIKDDETIGIQATSASNMSSRVKKSIESDALHVWLAGGSRSFEVWGWRKRPVKRGSKRLVWHCNRRIINATDMGERGSHESNRKESSANNNQETGPDHGSAKLEDERPTGQTA